MEINVQNTNNFMRNFTFSVGQKHHTVKIDRNCNTSQPIALYTVGIQKLIHHRCIHLHTVIAIYSLNRQNAFKYGTLGSFISQFLVRNRLCLFHAFALSFMRMICEVFVTTHCDRYFRMVYYVITDAAQKRST